MKTLIQSAWNKQLAGKCDEDLMLVNVRFQLHDRSHLSLRGLQLILKEIQLRHGMETAVEIGPCIL
jgi:hypothetical protein